MDRPASPTSATPALLTWLAVAAVLAVMAVALGVVGATVQTENTTCTSPNDDVTVGDCFVATEVRKVESHLLVSGTATLAAGSAASLLVAAALSIAPRRRTAADAA